MYGSSTYPNYPGGGGGYPGGGGGYPNPGGGAGYPSPGGYPGGGGNFGGNMTWTNERVPSVKPLPSGAMTVGQSITIRGRPTSDRFAINLLTDMSDQNKALHFNPRYSDRCIVRNTQRNGSWQSEERGGPMPLRSNQPFDIVFTAEQNSFDIRVNGQSLPRYNYKMPLNQVRYIGFSEGMIIDRVDFAGGNMSGTGGHYQPPQQPSHHQPQYPYPGGGGMGPQPLRNPPIPVTYSLGGPIRPGQMIVIIGVIRQGGEGRFNVNLQQGYSGDVKGLHFDVRMNYGNDRRVIVRNSQVNGQWQTEERHTPYFPFEYNNQFKLYIRCEQHQFKVAVDDQHMFEYNNRLGGLHMLDTVTVKGDVQIMEMLVQ